MENEEYFITHIKKKGKAQIVFNNLKYSLSKMPAKTPQIVSRKICNAKINHG